MLLKDNSERVINLLKEFKKLNDIDKIKLGIVISESNYINYNMKKIINLLKEVLIMLDSKYGYTIFNFSRCKKIMLLSSKFIELNEEDKKHYLIELPFNIYESDFNNKKVNSVINNKLDIYNIVYYFKQKDIEHL